MDGKGIGFVHVPKAYWEGEYQLSSRQISLNVCSCVWRPIQSCFSIQKHSGLLWKLVIPGFMLFQKAAPSIMVFMVRHYCIQPINSLLFAYNIHPFVMAHCNFIACRMPALTSLHISYGRLIQPFEKSEIPASLLRLELSQVCCSKAWMDSFLPKLSGLTELIMTDLRPTSW